MSFIFVKHFELPCVERCYINDLPCLALIVFILFVSREDVRTANVIAAEAVTCLVIDRE